MCNCLYLYVVLKFCQHFQILKLCIFINENDKKATKACFESLDTSLDFEIALCKFQIVLEQYVFEGFEINKSFFFNAK